MIKLTYKRVTDGTDVWYVDGLVKRGEVVLERIHGNINNVAGIRAAVRTLVESKPRYQRALAGG